jgi:hypothetical protein
LRSPVNEDSEGKYKAMNDVVADFSFCMVANLSCGAFNIGPKGNNTLPALSMPAITLDYLINTGAVYGNNYFILRNELNREQ